MRIERFEGKVISLIKQAAGEEAKAQGVGYGLLLLVLIGGAAYLTVGAFKLTIFYLAAVGLAALRGGKLAGYTLAILSAVMMEVSGLAAARQVPFYGVSCLNILLMSLVFMLFALLVCTLKDAYAKEKDTSRLDGLTGLFNVKAFSEVLIKEIERCRRFRHPFSVAYIACNNLAMVNEKMGQAAGDGILRLMAEGIHSTLRTTDVVGRIHGDEFVVLLTETDVTGAGLAMEKLQARLQEIITQHYPEVTFSAGIVSFSKCPYSFKEVLDMSELAMYEARLRGEPAILTHEFP